MAFKALYRAI